MQTPETVAAARAYAKGASKARACRAKERRGVYVQAVNPYRNPEQAMAWGQGFSRTYWPVSV
jgi:hypothetical protein